MRSRWESSYIDAIAAPGVSPEIVRSAVERVREIEAAIDWMTMVAVVAAVSGLAAILALWAAVPAAAATLGAIQAMRRVKRLVSRHNALCTMDGIPLVSFRVASHRGDFTIFEA